MEGTLPGVCVDRVAACPRGATARLYIPETHKAMVAVVLMALAVDNRVMTIYTKGLNASGYCEVMQVDPSR